MRSQTGAPTPLEEKSKFPLKISKQGMIVAFVPLVCEIAVVLTLIFLLQQSEHNNLLAGKSQAVISKAESLSKDFLDCAASSLTYGITHDEVFAQKYEQERKALPEELSDLTNLLQSSPNQGDSMQKITLLAERSLDLLDKVKKSCDAHEDMSVPFLTPPETRKEINQFLQQLTGEISELIEQQKKLEASSKSEAAQTSLSISWALACGIIINVLAAVQIYVYFIGNAANKTPDKNTDQPSPQEKESAKDSKTNGPAAAQIQKEVQPDSSVIREIEQRQQEIDERQREFNKLQRKFVALISHDVQNPLSTIGSTLRLLETGSYGQLSDEAREKTSLAYRELSDLMILINEWLLHETAQNSSFQLELKTQAISDLLNSAINTVTPLAQARGVAIDLQNNQVRVPMDYQKLHQVVVNLLVNAINISPAEAKVQITVSRHRDGLEVRITDQGNDITGEDVNHLFEKSADPAEDAKTQHRLGLKICKQIVEQHKGTIGVQLAEAQGTTFWFKLPLGSW